MRLSSLAAARPAYYDRNATSQLSVYLATVAPHANTTRWTVTVASGKKLQVEALTIRTIRSAVATVAGSYTAEIDIVSGATTMISSTHRYSDNTLNATYSSNPYTAFTLYAGEQAQAFTEDLSTGGTVQFAVNLKGTLYDA